MYRVLEGTRQVHQHESVEFDTDYVSHLLYRCWRLYHDRHQLSSKAVLIPFGKHRYLKAVP